MRRIILFVVAFLLPPSAFAGELRAVAGQWDYGLSGTVTDQGESLDFQDDLALRAEGRGSLRVEYAGANGWFPDWELGFSQLGARGHFERTETVFVGPVPVASTTIVRDTDGSFDDWDLALRYPLSIGRATLSLGATAKWLKGEIVIREEGEPESRHPYDEVVPLLHAQLRMPVGARLSLVAGGQGLEYQGSRALEWRASAELRIFGPLMLEAGWQEKRYDINAGSYALDARLDGLLLRGGFVF